MPAFFGRHSTLTWIGASREGYLWPIYLICVFVLGPERWMHTDSAFTLFRILNHQSLFYDRWACELLVWPGQILAYWGAPINWVMQSLNLCLPLMMWGAWLLFSHSAHRWLYFAMGFLGGAEAFFIGYSEIGLCTWAFISAIQCLSLNLKKNWITLPILLFVILHAHPAGWIYVPFLALFTGIFYPGKKAFITLCLCLILGLLKWVFFSTTHYDANLIHHFRDNLDLYTIYNSYSFHYIRSAAYFFIPHATVIACFCVSIFNPWRWQFTAFTLAFYAALIASVIVYSDGDATINMEKFFYPVSILGILSLAFYHSLSNSPKYGMISTKDHAIRFNYTNKITNFIPWFIALCFVLNVQKPLPFYQNRLLQLEKITRKMKNNKEIQADETLQKSIFGSTWAIPYETALSSTRMHLSSTHTIKNENFATILDSAKMKEIQRRIGDSLFLGAIFELPQSIQAINSHYFNFPKGTRYRVVNQNAPQ